MGLGRLRVATARHGLFKNANPGNYLGRNSLADTEETVRRQAYP